MNAVLNKTQLWCCDISDKNQLIFIIIDQIFSISKHINKKKNMVSLLKNMKILNQKFMKKHIHLLKLSKVVEIYFLIHLESEVRMILNLQISQLMKKLN